MMLGQNYYYLVAGLPDLILDQGKLQFGTQQLKEEFREGLSDSDYALFQHLLLVYDNATLLSLVQKEPDFEPKDGVYPASLLIAGLNEPGLLRPYMRNLVESQQAEAPLYPNLSPENELTTLYFKEMLALKNDFLRKWFTFELNLRNVTLVYAAKNSDIPYENQVIPANEAALVMRRSNSRDLGLASDWPWIERVMQIVEIPGLLDREKAIDQLRWNFLDELNTFNYFSLEVLLAYYIKLGIIERWLKLDKVTGEELFMQLLGDLQNTYEFPNEFSIKDGRK